MRSKTRADHYAESLTDVACDGESYDVIDAARVAFAIAIEEERVRCADICKARADRLRATAEQYPAGAAACFEAEARKGEREIRGEK